MDVLEFEVVDIEVLDVEVVVVGSVVSPLHPASRPAKSAVEAITAVRRSVMRVMYLPPGSRAPGARVDCVLTHAFTENGPSRYRRGHLSTAHSAAVTEMDPPREVKLPARRSRLRR